jgi:hypothetical protein
MTDQMMSGPLSGLAAAGFTVLVPAVLVTGALVTFLFSR